jgi:hypothetical protein
VRTGPLTWDNMLERERKDLVKKHTKVNCVPTPHKQQLVRKPIPRPPSPTAEGQTRAAREARRKRKAHQMETGVELGPGEDVGFMPKVLTPPKKGVRWDAPLESGYSSDLEVHSPSAAKRLKANNGQGLLVNSNVVCAVLFPSSSCTNANILFRPWTSSETWRVSPLPSRAPSPSSSRRCSTGARPSCFGN